MSTFDGRIVGAENLIQVCRMQLQIIAICSVFRCVYIEYHF